MNENPGETPNPLNPTPQAAPVAPAPAEPAPAAQPVAQPVAPTASTDVATPEAPKKKKTGLIVGIILGILAIGGIVAAILILFVFNKSGSGSSVDDAIIKLLSGENKRIAISTEISAGPDSDIPLSAKLSGQFDIEKQIGSMTADIEIQAEGQNNFAFNIEARSVNNSTAYLKISGVKDAVIEMLEKQGNIDCDTTDCSVYFDMMINSGDSTNPFATLLDIDEKWIELDVENILDKFLSITIGGAEAEDLTEKKIDFADLYKKHPFLTASTENLEISKKSNTLYKLSIDYEKLADFINEISDEKVTANSIKESIKSGDIYVEIDGNNNITRIYAKASEGLSDFDLDISYPSEVKVEKPTDYIDSDNLIPLFSIFGNSLQIEDPYDDYDWDDDYDDDYDDYDWDDDDYDYYDEDYDDEEDAI